MDKRPPSLLAASAVALCVLLCACATPVFRDVDNAVAVAASDVQQDPEAFRGAEPVGDDVTLVVVRRRA